MGDLGSVGSVFVDIEGRLDSLNQTMAQAVPAAAAAGEKAGQAFSQGVNAGTSDASKQMALFGDVISEAGHQFTLFGNEIPAVKLSEFSGGLKDTSASAADAATSVNSATRSWLGMAGGTDEANKALKDLGGTLKDAGGALVLIGAGITAASGALLELGFHSLEVAGQFERTQIAMSALLGSASAGADEMNLLIGRFKDSGVALGEVTDNVKILLARGFDTTEANKMIGILLDSVNALGTGDAGLTRLIQAFDNLKTRGTASMISLNTLARNGIPAIQILSEQLGVSTEQIRKDVEKGVVSSATAIDALLKGMSQRYGGMTETIATTFSGMFANIENHGTLAFKALGDALLPLGKEFEKAILPMIDDLAAVFKWFADLPDGVKEFTAAIVLMGVAAGTATTALGGTLYVTGQIIGAVPGLVKVAETLGLIKLAQVGTEATAAAEGVSALTGAVGGLAGGAGLTALGTAIGSAVIGLASLAGAVIVTEQNLGKLETQATDAADAIRKFSIQKLIAEGNTNIEDLQKMGASLDELKKALGGADLAGKAWTAGNVDFGDGIHVTAGAVKGYSFEVASLIEKQKKADEALREAQQNVNELKAALDSGAPVQGAYNLALIDLEKATKAAHPEVVKLKDALAAYHQELKLVGAFTYEDIKKQAESFADVAREVGRASAAGIDYSHTSLEVVRAIAKLREEDDKHQATLQAAVAIYGEVIGQQNKGIISAAALAEAQTELRNAVTKAYPELKGHQAAIDQIVSAYERSVTATDGFINVNGRLVSIIPGVKTGIDSITTSILSQIKGYDGLIEVNGKMQQVLPATSKAGEVFQSIIDDGTGAVQKFEGAISDGSRATNLMGQALSLADQAAMHVGGSVADLTSKTNAGTSQTHDYKSAWSEAAIALHDADGNLVVLTHDMQVAASTAKALAAAAREVGASQASYATQRSSAATPGTLGTGSSGPVDGIKLAGVAASYTPGPGHLAAGNLAETTPEGSRPGDFASFIEHAAFGEVIDTYTFAVKKSSDAAAAAVPLINQFGESLTGVGDDTRKTAIDQAALNDSTRAAGDAARALQDEIDGVYQQMQRMRLAGQDTTPEFQALQNRLLDLGNQLAAMQNPAAVATAGLQSFAGAVVQVAGISVGATTIITGLVAQAAQQLGTIARLADLGSAITTPNVSAGSAGPSGSFSILPGFGNGFNVGNSGTIPSGTSGAGSSPGLFQPIIQITGGTFTSVGVANEIGHALTQVLRLGVGQRL